MTLRRAAVEILRRAATRAQILSHPPDIPYISAKRTSRVPAARLDPRLDRGNNDRMERTMGRAGDAGGNAIASRRAAASRLSSRR